MSGPGGTSTKRDQRRETRRSQFQQRQLERQRERQRRIRQQRIRNGAIIGVGVLVVALLAFLLIHAATGGGGAASTGQPGIVNGTGTYTTPAGGDVRDGMTCLGSEGTVEHIHMYLAVYVDGHQVQVPPNTGIVNNSCFYPLHVHSDQGDENIIHEESPDTKTYTLGAFFDVWGQPLSSTQVMNYTVGKGDTLKFVTIDANGKQTVVTGNPLNIQFTPHETIYILYDSPTIHPTQFKNFLPGE